MSLLNPDQTPEQTLQSQMAANEAALTRPPFAGFLIRLFAFFIDGLILYGIAGILNGMAGNGIFKLNPWLPWIGHATGFLYFFLCAGPIGRGRTLGMNVVGLHIIDRNGQPLGWAAAFRRTLLQSLAIFGLLSVTGNASYHVLAFPPSERYAALLVIMAVSLLGVTLFIALAMSMGIHPHKRGWHDLLAGSFVTRDPTPSRFHAILAEKPDPLTERRLKNHLILTVPFWFVAFVVLSFGPFQTLLRGQFMMQADHARALNEGPLAGSTMAVLQIDYPSAKGATDFRKGVEAGRGQMIANGQDAPTTETIRRFSSNDGETIALYAMQRRGPFPQDGIDSPAFREGVERTRDEAWKLWPEYRDTWKAKTGEDLPPANRFFFILHEQAQILAFSRGGFVAAAFGPADPALGPLTFEHPTSMSMQAAAAMDAATTATQPAQ